MGAESWWRSNDRVKSNQGVGTEVDPFPLVEFRYGDLYFDGGEFGYDVWGNDKWSTSVFLSFEEGYDVKGSDLDKGYNKIEDRDAQIEGGLEIGYDLGNDYEISLRIAFGEEGNRYSLEGDKLIFISDKTTLKTTAFFTFNDSSYTDYYFGVTEKEAAKPGNYKIDKAYKPGSSYSMGFEISGEHRFTESVSMVAMAGIEYLSSDVKDSPVVENNFIYETALGLKYTF